MYDFGSRRTQWPGEGDDHKIPRAVWWGLAWSRYALLRLWKLPLDEPSGALLRGYNVTKLYDSKLANLPKPLAKRLKYYRKFVARGSAGGRRDVDLVGVYGVEGTVRAPTATRRRFSRKLS